MTFAEDFTYFVQHNQHVPDSLEPIELIDFGPDVASFPAAIVELGDRTRVKVPACGTVPPLSVRGRRARLTRVMSDGWSADEIDEAEEAAEQRDAALDKRAQIMRRRARASASTSAAPPPPPPPATAAARRTAEQLLLRALEENNPDLAEYPRAHMARLAAALAAALSSVAGPRAYASRVRSVAYNLRSHNHELRRRVCAELVAPAEVAAMPAASLATDALRQEREETAVRKRKGVTQRPDEGGTRAATSSAATCGRSTTTSAGASCSG